MHLCIDLLPVHLDSCMAMLSIESVVIDYISCDCLYMDNWSPSIGEEFELEIEEFNRHNRYAMSIKVSGGILGHVGFSNRS